MELKQASQEATAHFIMNKQKRANTNKKTATDMNTPLRFMEVDGMKMIELNAYLRRSYGGSSLNASDRKCVLPEN